MHPGFRLVAGLRLRDEAKEAFKRGYLANEKGDFDLAIAEYTEAIRRNPKYADAYECRGETYYRKGDYDTAITDCTEAIRLDPKDTGNVATAYYGRGRAYDAKWEWDKAIADYTEVIRLDPTDARAYDRRGWAYVHKGDYDTAIASYTEAIRIDPKHASPYYGRGLRLRREVEPRQGHCGLHRGNPTLADLCGGVLRPGSRLRAEGRLRQSQRGFR